MHELVVSESRVGGSYSEEEYGEEGGFSYDVNGSKLRGGW